MEESRDVAVCNTAPQPLTTREMGQQVALIQDMMKHVMKENEHYGKIPGCGPKPTLLKAGAEKLCMTFRLAPDIDVEVVDMGTELHREYRVKVVLYSPTGQRLGAGVGSCSTLEKKYRERKEKGTDKFIPNNPPDMYNTCLKMAKKRALVDAVLTTTAASDIFTQDIEEMKDIIAQTEPEPSKVESVRAKPAPARPAPTPQPRQSAPPAEVTIEVPFEEAGPEAYEEQAPAAAAPANVNLSVQDQLYKELSIACGMDEDAMSNLLKDLSQFDGKDGKPMFMKLGGKWSDKWAGSTLKKLREANYPDDYMPTNCTKNPDSCGKGFVNQDELWACSAVDGARCPYGMGMSVTF